MTDKNDNETTDESGVDSSDLFAKMAGWLLIVGTLPMAIYLLTDESGMIYVYQAAWMFVKIIGSIFCIALLICGGITLVAKGSANSREDS